MIKNKKYLKAIIILIITSFFLSCLEIETKIEIKEDLSGVWNLTYRIMKEVSLITPGKELSGYNYFPLNETEFKKRIDGIPGLDLISFSTKDTIMYTQISSEMRFANTNDIQFFFNTYSENELITIDLTEKGVFKLAIFNPFPEIGSTETLNLISQLYTDKNAEIVVLMPGIVKESNKGLLSENPLEASYSIKILETLKLTEPDEWIVSYE